MAPDYETMSRWTTEQWNAYHKSIFNDRFETKKETKKERIKRIATELMFESWNLHDQITLTIIKIKQYCKPRHINKQFYYEKNIRC